MSKQRDKAVSLPSNEFFVTIALRVCYYSPKVCYYRHRSGVQISEKE
jgi:hypothetical protein